MFTAPGAPQTKNTIILGQYNPQKLTPKTFNTQPLILWYLTLDRQPDTGYHTPCHPRTLHKDETKLINPQIKFSYTAQNTLFHFLFMKRIGKKK